MTSELDPSLNLYVKAALERKAVDPVILDVRVFFANTPPPPRYGKTNG